MCESCQPDKPPIGIRLISGFTALYSFLLIIFSYSINARLPKESGVTMLFGIVLLLSTPGIYRLDRRKILISGFTYSLLAISGVLSVIFLDIFPISGLIWFVPIPFLVGYLYRLLS